MKNLKNFEIYKSSEKLYANSRELIMNVKKSACF